MERPLDEKETWLALIEAVVLKGIGKLEAEELASINAYCDLDVFYEAQSEQIKKAVNATIAVNGHGLETLLEGLMEYELS